MCRDSCRPVGGNDVPAQQRKEQSLDAMDVDAGHLPEGLLVRLTGRAMVIPHLIDEHLGDAGRRGDASLDSPFRKAAGDRGSVTRSGQTSIRG